MRLLKVSSVDHSGEKLQLSSFVGKSIPPYAILSHTWGEDEVLFEDVKAGTSGRRLSYDKVEGAALRAAQDGYEYIWIDTCCINKDSSAELQEAINSMYAWYQRSGICYAYLEDFIRFTGTLAFRGYELWDNLAASKWFTRGWTLQELLAPKVIFFYSRDWSKLGQLDRQNPHRLHSIRPHAAAIRSAGGSPIRLNSCSCDSCFRIMIGAITNIDVSYLDGSRHIQSASVAARMSWASKRATTREEDIAYCLLGIFDVNMPLLYGEESKAFLRLQEEIMKQTDDHTLFAWEAHPSWALDHEVTGLLATHPMFFDRSGNIVRVDQRTENDPHVMTSRGLEIELLLDHNPQSAGEDQLVLAMLDCTTDVQLSRLGIYLKRQRSRLNQYTRVLPDRLMANVPDDACAFSKRLYINQRPAPEDRVRPSDRPFGRSSAEINLYRRDDAYHERPTLAAYYLENGTYSYVEDSSAELLRTIEFSAEPGRLSLALAIELKSSVQCLILFGALSTDICGLEVMPFPYDSRPTRPGHAVETIATALRQVDMISLASKVRLPPMKEVHDEHFKVSLERQGIDRSGLCLIVQRSDNLIALT